MAGCRKQRYQYGIHYPEYLEWQHSPHLFVMQSIVVSIYKAAHYLPCYYLLIGWKNVIEIQKCKCKIYKNIYLNDCEIFICLYEINI